MKYVLIPLLFFFARAHGQGSLTLAAGGGSYAMSDMKAFQQEFARDLPEMKVISTFPIYWTYDLGYKYILRNGILLGATISVMSTGGRLSYADYSGHANLDQLLNAWTFSWNAGYEMPIKNSQFRIQFDLRPGVTFSDCAFTSEVTPTPPGSFTTTEGAFVSTNWSVQPTVTLLRRYKRFAGNISAGLYITVVSGKMYLAEDHNYFLLKPNSDDPAHVDWTGLRLTGGVSYFFRKE